MLYTKSKSNTNVRSFEQTRFENWHIAQYNNSNGLKCKTRRCTKISNITSTEQITSSGFVATDSRAHEFSWFNCLQQKFSFKF